MKILWEKYLTEQFPNVSYKFYTNAINFKTSKKNIIINYVK